MTLPNIITSFRLIGTICLLFLKPFSAGFYVVYTLCGLSDVLDGLIARATKKTSEFGAKLDSVADILFYSVMLIKIFPVLWLQLPKVIWYIVAGILAVRILAYLVAAIKYHCFASQHTYMNKLTGAAVFSIPYFLTHAGDVIACFVVCVIAGLASLEELLIHALSKEYRPGQKTILM